MHLHIFKRGFSILCIENFWIQDPKTYYKIYTNAYICIYFYSAEILVHVICIVLLIVIATKKNIMKQKNII